MEEDAKLHPQYPQGQHMLLPDTYQEFSLNFLNTEFVQAVDPAPVGPMSKKTLKFHCGYFKNFSTPACTVFFKMYFF